MKINIGIQDAARERISQTLAKILADTYVLSAKTQGFHWNVKGPHFYALHKLFEEQYDALQDALDPLAERIRALGVQAPGALQSILKLASLHEQSNAPSASAMIAELQQDHEAVIRLIRDSIDAISDTRDEVTSDMLTERLAEHEKFAWMLRVSAQD